MTRHFSAFFAILLAVFFFAACGSSAVDDNDSSECTPMTCEELGAECGAHDDLCDSTVECGGCSDDKDCTNGTCVADDSDLAPTTTIDAHPNDPATDAEATFEFSCDRPPCTFECELDGATEDCSSPTTYTDLDDGEHTFRGRATDEDGLTGDWAEHVWTVATDEPIVVDLQGPANHTNETDATFTFGCSESDCTFECSLNGSDFESCDSGVIYTDLDDGDHLFEVRATNSTGVTGPMTDWSWTVDTVPPEVVFTQTPEAETTETSATFEFSCADDDCVAFECALYTGAGDGTFEPCPSPQEFTALATGVYWFHVRGFDAAGNLDETEYIWEVIDDTFQLAQISAGGYHSCGIDEVGELYCWGRNDMGQLGDGTDEEHTTPNPVDLAGPIKEVSAGWLHTCAIDDDDALWCWGHGSDGRLGHGTFDDDNSFEPVPVAGGFSWKTVDAGYFHTCAIRDDDTAWCWGYGNPGQLGNGSSDNQHSPVQVGSEAGWTQVSGSGELHSCGRRVDGSAWCWGSNFHGTLGDGEGGDGDGGGSGGGDTNEPVGVDGPDEWQMVDTGVYNSCGLRDDGTAWCWGKNQWGQVGDGTETQRTTPEQVDFSGEFSTLYTDYATTCALDTTDSLWCWGWNNYGEFGNGTIGGSESSPTEATPGYSWQELSIGERHACGIENDGTAWCWGDNEYGQRGDGGEADPVDTPQPVVDP